MISSFFDAHGHPNFVAYKDDRDEVIKRALLAGVFMTVVGTQKDTSQVAIDLAEKYEEGVYAIIGLHPIHTGKSYHDEEELGEGGKEFTPLEKVQNNVLLSKVSDNGKSLFLPEGGIRSSLTGFTSRGEEFDFATYQKMAENPKVVAIGECGLDFFRMQIQDSRFKNEEEYIQNQEKAFKQQIELAIKVKKPLMLHLRNGQSISAYNRAFSILESCFMNLESHPKGNLHFFAGTWEEAKPFLDIGFNFSFTGVITFTHDYDEIIKKLPLGRIMAETDCPYVAPVPYRGKRNEPAYVVEIVKKIAEIRGEGFEKVRKQILENTLKFFGL